MQDLASMAEVQPSQKLEHEELEVVRRQRTRMLHHVLTQICVLRTDKRRGNRREETGLRWEEKIEA